MKTGMTLHEMATALEATREAKADMIGPTDQLYMTPDGKVEIDGIESGALEIAKHANRQITTWAKIPAQYADRCPPELLANNVNHWFKHGVDGKGAPARMLRTINPNPYLGIEKPTLRAFVSDKYRRIDNYDVFEAVYPKLAELSQRGGIKIDSVNVSDEKFYIKAHLTDIEERVMREGHQIGVGHNSYYIVRPGIEIRNSEIGKGSFSVAPCLWEDHCTNRAVFRKNAQKRYHVGAAQSDGELWKMLSDETQRVSNQALMMQISDYVSSALDSAGDVFQETVNQLREKMGLEIVRPEATMKLLAGEFQISDRESSGIVAELIKQGDMNAYGMQAAITKFSQGDALSYDRASELEGIAGEVIELPAQRWQTILEQAETLKLAA